ncbi:MAG TPA: response regulator [Ktedonobacterales bacterium]|nr:response regulator [Ktedonobacterales bacterium]
MNRDRHAGIPATGRRAPGPHEQMMSVLFVDPDRAHSETLAHALLGRHAVAIVGTAKQAQSAISLRTPDLVVMELDLPDTSGLELLRAIHSAPATRNVLILVVTRRASVKDKIAAFQAGADDYLVKPVDPEQFETHVLLVSKFRKVIGAR